MASEIPFPCLCEEESPHFDTQHDVATLIAEYQDAGHIKKCAHLHIERFDHVLERSSTYGPGCHKDSFDLRQDPYGSFRVRYFYGCPKDCRLYYPAWRGSAEKWIGGRWWHIRRGWWVSLSGMLPSPRLPR